MTLAMTLTLTLSLTLPLTLHPTPDTRCTASRSLAARRASPASRRWLRRTLTLTLHPDPGPIPGPDPDPGLGPSPDPDPNQAAKEFFEREQLDGSLNGDEAAAFGATLYAAKQASSPLT